jgi:4'-phosphopantetheinyl transferase
VRVLSADESERAGRFVFEKDRVRYTLARGALRYLLAAYTGVRPEALRFGYTAFQKPFLVYPDQAVAPAFNVTHSEDLVLIAVTDVGPVGVDIEYMRPLTDLDRLAEQVFTERERSTLYRRSLSERTRAFFTGWTRKEAYIKAVGQGLSIPLTRFEVSLDPYPDGQIHVVPWTQDEGGPWGLVDLDPEAEATAAVSVKGTAWQVSCWQWTPELAGAQ